MIFLMYSDGLYNVLAIGHIVAVIFEFYYYAHLVDDLDDKVITYEGVHIQRS